MGVYVDERPRRVGRPRQPETDAAILEATIELLSEGGRDAATIDAIAARSRTAKTTIYRRWASVDELFLDAMLLAARGDEEDFRNADLDHPLGAMLRAEARNVMRVIQSPLIRGTFPTTAREMLGETPIGLAFRDKVFRPIRAERREMLRARVAAGELSPTVDLDLVLDLLNGALLYRVIVGEPLDAAVADRIADLVGRAVGVVDGRPRVVGQRRSRRQFGGTRPVGPGTG